MELLQLRYFCDAASTENFSKTAQKFGVPASNISQSIRRLEKELALSLFTRQANRVSLNAHGAAFYQKVSAALDLISDAVSEVSDDGQKGIINICINTNRRIVMRTVEKFKRQYADVHIKTKALSNPMAEDFDLIISEENGHLRNYERQLLISEKIAVAVNRESPLASCEKLDVAMLASEPFITMNDQSSMFALTRKICGDFGFAPHIAVQSDDPFYIRKCVELGLGITIFPLFSWREQFSESVVLRCIDGYTRKTYVYTNTKKYIPVCVRNFQHLLIEECRKEQADYRNQLK